MAAQTCPMRVQINRREIEERIFDHHHLSLRELAERLTSERIGHGYLYNHVPPYPRPELHVTHLSHSTDLSGLHSIKQDGGFRDLYERELVWFSLTVTPDDLGEAEDRDMKIVYPDEDFREELCEPGRVRDPEIYTEGQTGFLQMFSSSPAFSSKSRYGSYRFTFSLRDVLNKYSRQFCAGERPIMRRCHTLLFKQEVAYVVLVHPPTNQMRFSDFPELSTKQERSTDPTNQEADPICEFRGDHFIWRPQAMCNVHSHQLVKTGDDTWEVEDTHDYYVWDNVVLALFVEGQVFEFDDLELRQSLRFCEKLKPSKERFEDYGEAKAEVNRLWPLQKFTESKFNVSL